MLSLLLGLFTFVGMVPCVYGALEMPSEASFDKVIKENKLVTAVEGETEVKSMVEKIFSEANLKIANGILAGVAFIYLVILGMKMLFSHGDTERIASYRAQFAYMMIGLAVISLAYYLGFEIFSPDKSTLDDGGDASLNAFNQMGDGIIDYLRIIVATIGLMVILISGYQLITAPEEETVQNEKSFARAFLLGIGFILLSEVAIRILSGDNFADGNDTKVTASLAEEGISEIVGIVNYLLTFIAGAAFFMMVLAAFYYVISFGDEDRTSRAKKIIISNLVAGIIAFSSLVMIRVFING